MSEPPLSDKRRFRLKKRRKAKCFRRRPLCSGKSESSWSCIKKLLQNRNGSMHIERKESTMKILIVEDDFTSRLLLQKILSAYGECHIAVNGREAVDAFRTALAENKPYDLICLDIMMPEMDGMAVLKNIRGMEEEAGVQSSNGVKIIMTTALGDPKNVVVAFKALCDAYLVKPVNKSKLLDYLRSFGLIS